MKKNIKTLRKRGFALFLALTMCISTTQIPAFAAEEPSAVEEITDGTDAGNTDTGNTDAGTGDADDSHEDSEGAEDQGTEETGDGAVSEPEDGSGDENQGTGEEPGSAGEDSAANEDSSEPKEWEDTVTVTDSEGDHQVDVSGTETTTENGTVKEGTGEFENSEGSKVDVTFKEETDSKTETKVETETETRNPFDSGALLVPGEGDKTEGTDNPGTETPGADEGEKPPVEGEGQVPEGTQKPDPDEGEEKPPIEGEEKPPVEGEEKPPVEGEEKPPVEGEEGDKKPADPSIDLTVTPDKKDDEQKFIVDPSTVLPQPEVPEKFGEGEADEDGTYQLTIPNENYEDENGKGTQTVTETWKNEKLEEGYGFKTTETRTTVTEVVRDNVPDTMPEGATVIEGGYEYSKTENLEDGTVRTIIVTVMNGTTTTKTTDVIITEKIQTVTQDEESGKITVSMSEVVKGDNQGTDVNQKPAELTSFDVFQPGYGPSGYNSFGYDEKNDLFDREGSKGFATVEITASTLNVRSGPGAGNNKVSSLAKGTTVTIFEKSENGWYRIGENAWISGSYVDQISGIYQVNTKWTNVYEEAGSGARIGARGNNAYVRVIEASEDGQWYKVASDGNVEGWVLASSLTAIDVNNHDHQVQDFAKQFDTDIKEAIFPEGYEYIYLGEHGLEGSIRVDSDDKWQAHQFILRDKETNKYYVYCADIDTGAHSGYAYKMVPLESVKTGEANKDDPSYVDYLDAEKLEHLKAIAQNGYWGEMAGTEDKSLSDWKNNKSLNEYLEKTILDGEGKPDKEAIQNVLDSITSGIALTATQAALWVYGNRGREIDKDPENWEKYLGTYFDPETGKLKAGFYEATDENEKAALKAVFNWLVNDNSEIPGASTVEAITENNFEVSNATITVNHVVEEQSVEKVSKSVDRVMYDTDVTFALQVTSSNRDKDDLIVQVFVHDGDEVKCVAVCRLNGNRDENDESKLKSLYLTGDVKKDLNYNQDNGQYTIKGIQLPGGAKITINLNGTQDLGKGVYVFKSQQKDGAESQTFIGVTEDTNKQKVDLNVTLDFNVTDARATIVTTTTTTETHEQTTISTRYEREKPEEPKEPDDPEDPKTPDPEDPKTPDPEDPKTPEPERPNRPEDPGDPGNSYDPAPRPRGGNPVIPTTNIPDEAVPLAAMPELVQIFDDEVPLAAVPKTGDSSASWYMMTIFAACALFGLSIFDRKKSRSAED